jgi:hypothetical protein
MKLRRQVRSQMEFGNEEKAAELILRQAQDDSLLIP